MTAVETRRQILFTKRESGVAVLMLDCVGKLNYLGRSVISELEQALRIIEEDRTIKAAVMMSGKPDNFVIGADVFEIRKMSTFEELHALSSDGHAALNLVARSKKPVVVAINGPCFGGGLELALSGHWRIATSDGKTEFAFPETKLGLIPGLGGTQRTPRLIGLKAALGLILSAEPVSAQEALEMGLIDELVPSSELMSAAESRALALAADPAEIATRVESTESVKATKYCLRDLTEDKADKLFAMTERSVRIKTRGHYPAQLKVVEVMRKGVKEGLEAGLAEEARVFAELAHSEVSANLMALFFATDFARQSAASLAAKFGEQDTTRLGVVGGGTMGSSIATLAATRGMNVKVRVNPDKEIETTERLHSLVPSDFTDRIQVTSNWADLADSQLVLETVAEDLSVKTEVLSEIEKVVSPECTIATNTSSLPLEELVSVLQKQDRFVGVHFFHPVDRMTLVEVVALKTTSRKSLARAADVVLRLDKIPAMVKNGPGFLINRMIVPYIQESARAMEQGIPVNWSEDAVVQFGLPIGPMELVDEVGADVAFTVVESLEKAFGERMRPPEVMYRFQALGAGGKKHGAGIWMYDNGGRRGELNPQIFTIEGVCGSEEKAPKEELERLAERFIFPMIDEAARCLEDRIVMKPREIDMAIVHGIGFPPFRGGLLKYADRIGLPKVAERLKEIYGDGPRTVSPLIQKYIAEGRGFYSRAGKEDE